MTSFLGAELEQYTAFQAHTSDIRQLLPVPGGLLSITADELRYTTRTGLPLYTVRSAPPTAGSPTHLIPPHLQERAATDGDALSTVPGGGGPSSGVPDQPDYNLQFDNCSCNL